MVYTDFRPTPLQHYIFPAGGDGLFLVVDEKVCGFIYFAGLTCVQSHVLNFNTASCCHYVTLWYMLMVVVAVSFQYCKPEVIGSGLILGFHHKIPLNK